MAKKSGKPVAAKIRLQIPAGKASPAPPVGPALGQHSVPIMDFCQEFNARTQDKEGLIIPVVITVYEDRSFEFITKTPPAAILLKRAANIVSGSGEPNKNKVGTVTRAQVEEIARTKMPDLNVYDVEAGVNVIAGTARSMGILIEGIDASAEEARRQVAETEPSPPEEEEEEPEVEAGAAESAPEAAEAVPEGA